MGERKYRVMQCVCEGKTKSVGIYDCGPGDICCRSDEDYYVIMSVMATDYQDAKRQVLEKIETSSTLTWLREWIRAAGSNGMEEEVCCDRTQVERVPEAQGKSEVATKPKQYGYCFQGRVLGPSGRFGGRYRP